MTRFTGITGIQVGSGFTRCADTVMATDTIGGEIAVVDRRG